MGWLANTVIPRNEMFMFNSSHIINSILTTHELFYLYDCIDGS
jgi:hypothetical protein